MDKKRLEIVIQGRMDCMPRTPKRMPALKQILTNKYRVLTGSFLQMDLITAVLENIIENHRFNH